MLPLLRFLFFRFLSIIISLLVITATLYAVIIQTPPEIRAELYIPRGANLERFSEQQRKEYINRIILQNGLYNPYPIQYISWISNLLRGEWGYSQTMDSFVIDALLVRTPVTAELTLYSLIFFIPLGLVSGAIAGWKRNQVLDYLFRFSAFVAISLPTFVLAIVLMAIFYVALHWLPPERLGIQANAIVNSTDFHFFTGLLTVDGLLNRRPEVGLDAARHLVLPVLTLSLLHWATLGRVMRATLIDELHKEYTTVAKAHGLSDWSLLWRHPFPNAISPALASSALSAASLITGVFVVERIYNFHGVSELIVSGLLVIPDAPVTMGFAVYSVLMVLSVMLILDILRLFVDPRSHRGWGDL